MFDENRERNFINSVHDDGTIDFHQFRKNFNVRHYHNHHNYHKNNK